MGSVYMITNTENGKAYIGKSINDAKKKRVQKHLTGHGSRIIKQAIEKYGKDAFVVEILHDGIIPEFLDDLEIEAIAKYDTVAPNGYNLTIGGEGTRGHTPWNKGKKMPPEFCQQVSDRQKGKSHTNKGKPFSVEHRRKLSEAHKGKPSNRKGKKASIETRRRISEAGKGRIVSAETRKKHAKRWVGDKNPRANPFRDAVKQFYFSLPCDMDISEKRKRIREKFPQIINATICKWVKKWQSENG